VDSRYAEEKGYLGPYHNTRYRLDDFEGRSEHTLSNHEKFNLFSFKASQCCGMNIWGAQRNVANFGRCSVLSDREALKIILACFALNNYLWECEHGDGSTRYPPSEFVAVNRDSNMSLLRELITIGICYAN
jgi:hypothetical protein